MIIQKLASALRRQDWFQVVIEVMIVIVGIFLGLQVSNLNEERKERIEAEAFLDKLALDIRFAITNLEEKRDQRIQFVEDGTLAVKYFRGEVEFEDHSDDILRGIRSITRTSNLPIHTGNIEVILLGQNYPKTDDLSLYLRIDELIEDIKSSENVVNHIREELNLTIPILNKYYGDNENLEHEFPALYDLEVMKNSTEFRYALQSDVVAQNFNVIHYRNNIARFQEILELIENRK